jgi:amidase
MPHAGLEGSHDGMDNIIGVVGPLATSARDLELFCSVMLQYQAWRLEHAALEIPWKPRESLNLPKQLCFAILKDDGVVTPHPPILDALALTRKVSEPLFNSPHFGANRLILMEGSGG